jgi:hypothetical protein
MIFVGQNSGPDTNIYANNVNKLCNVANGCSIDTYLSKNTAVRFNGCTAGSTILDAYAGYRTSIAQLISNQLKRGVYAYDVGTYFSQQDANHDKHFDATSVTKKLPDSLPMYLIPAGVPGHKPSPVPFTSH